ncbi:DUF3540 domain-containing protein [Aquabacterium sp. A7-Y]|uniref:DUF3540 domain-containing protein n=1 Tax=Aquabacterium sp. A7-Y TaxID=1349605 RepID=UPI00223DFDD9|nr:DUF3540 domain-containing protein [Aquabacterium sp. A7-Y]MCW7540759.1 DUF3540 domain-containing protein [Aquabacterium sp. A7-Y]
MSLKSDLAQSEPPADAAASFVTQAVVQALGEVERSRDGVVVVSSERGLLQARLAVSCLVQPECGDTVLVALRGPQAYVLAVLERASEAPLAMVLPCSASLSVQGDLRLQARGAISLQGEAVEAVAGRISLVGQAVHWLADTLESTAARMKQVAGLWTVQVKSHHRHVEDMEMVRAGHVDLRAEEVLHLNAGHTVMKSRELVKIDGKQIQVG